MHTNMQLNSRKTPVRCKAQQKSAAKECLSAEPLGTFCYAHWPKLFSKTHNNIPLFAPSPAPPVFVSS